MIYVCSYCTSETNWFPEIYKYDAYVSVVLRAKLHFSVAALSLGTWVAIEELGSSRGEAGLPQRSIREGEITFPMKSPHLLLPGTQKMLVSGA